MMKHILCIQICKLFAALLEMESLAPEIRGCRFQWEADQLKFHSRFLHLFYFSARPFLFIHSSQRSSLYWWLSRPIFPCSFFVCPPISSTSLVSFPLLEFAPPPPPLLLPSPLSLLSLPVTPVNPVFLLFNVRWAQLYISLVYCFSTRHFLLVSLMI